MRQADAGIPVADMDVADVHALAEALQADLEAHAQAQQEDSDPDDEQCDSVVRVAIDSIEALEKACEALIAAECGGSSILALCEELDMSDQQSELHRIDPDVLSPLSIAAWVCLSELHGKSKDFFPNTLPIAVSAPRATNILMRSAYVLIQKKLQDPPREGGSPSYGLDLFAERAVPMLKVAARQMPKAVASLSGGFCRWQPPKLFRAVLESLAALPDLEREDRTALFKIASAAMREFDWPCRFELYLEIIQQSRTDQVIGAVVTLVKDDWWQRACDLSKREEPLHDDRLRLVRLIKATLSGDMQIIDGMDTLTASLNIARLVTLAAPPLGTFMRQSLRSSTSSATAVDLDALLSKISAQIDFEMKLLDAPKEKAPNNALARHLAEELGKAEGAPDLNLIKKSRIAMVAHLVARVRELLLTPPAGQAS